MLNIQMAPSESLRPLYFKPGEGFLAKMHQCCWQPERVFLVRRNPSFRINIIIFITAMGALSKSPSTPASSADVLSGPAAGASTPPRQTQDMVGPNAFEIGRSNELLESL